MQPKLAVQGFTVFVRLVISGLMLCLCMSSLAAPPSPNVGMQAVITDANWVFNGSRDRCEISQGIPNLGDAIFVSEPGDALQFSLDAVRPLASSGKFDVLEVAPVWHPEAPNQAVLGKGDSVVKGNVLIASPLSDRMLMSLYRGFEPRFRRIAWFDTQAQVEVSLRSIHFRDVYEQFLACQNHLLSDKFSELARSSLQFSVDKWNIPESVQARLLRLARYLKEDERIVGVFIDGHTDDSGELIKNQVLSKNRAENVAKFFVDAGVDEALMTVRYHADRYPIASNSTHKGKAKNRRTTIRLQRKAEIELADIDSKTK